MPWYDGNIPAKWETALEKKIGAKIAVKAVLDPDGLNLTLNGEHDLVSAGTVGQVRDMSIDYGGRAIVQDVALVFNDPDNYFSPDNTASPFHQAEGTLSADASATDTTLKLLSFTGFSFAADEVLLIGDGTNEEEIVVASFTADNGSTGYHELVIDAPGLVNTFSAGTRIWTKPVVGKEIVISLVNLTESTSEELVLFRGNIIRAPELLIGQARITISDTRKKQLDTIIVGADSGADLKLMTVGVDGALESSINWGEQFNKAPLVYSVDEGQLPNGLLLNSSTGVISGTPTAAGEFTFTVRVTNADGDYVTQEITMVVFARINTEFEAALGLDDYTVDVPNGTGEIVDGEFVFDFANTSKYKHRLGELAPWAEGDSRDDRPASIVYKPDNIASTNWSVIACIDSTNFPTHPTVDNAMAALFVRSTIAGLDQDIFCVGYHKAKDSIRAFDFNADNSYSAGTGHATKMLFRLRKSGAAYEMAYKAVGASSWTVLVSQNMTIGTPIDIGVFYFQSDSDEGGFYDYIDVGFAVDYFRYYEGALAVATTELPVTVLGDVYDFTLKASGGAGEYTWDISAGTLPSGLSLDGATGQIGGTPLVAGTSNFTVRVTDGSAATATQAVSIEVGDYEILPTILPWGEINIEYSETLRLYIGGNLDRSLVTIGSRCPLGRWTFTFTSSTEFNVETPGLGKFTGDILTEFSIASVITIPAAAWFSGMQTGDTMTFITGKTWVTENPVQIIYDILTEIAGLSPKQLHASSYFGDVALGTVSDHDTDTEEIDVAVTLPAIIAAGEALEIGEDDVAVVTGNTEASSYPPTISLVIDESSGDLTGELVTWKQRAAVDESFLFDAEYAYCETSGILLSICLDREMTIAQAIEAVGSHAQMFEFHNFGVEGVHSFRPRYQATVKELTEAELKDALAIEAKELANVIIVKYAYDYFNEEYQYSYTYPASNTDNPSYQRHGVRVEKTIYAPGIYNAGLAEHLARRIYELYANGVELLRFNLDLRGLPFRIGELVDVDIDDPEKDKRFEVVEKKIQSSKSKNVELAGYNRTLFDKFAIADAALADVHCAW